MIKDLERANDVVYFKVDTVYTTFRNL